MIYVLVLVKGFSASERFYKHALLATVFVFPRAVCVHGLKAAVITYLNYASSSNRS